MAIPLIDILDKAYHFVADKLLPEMQQYETGIAAVCGFAGTGAVVWGLQALSKNVVDKIIPGFDKKVLPKIEAACVAITSTGPFVYYHIDPANMQKIISEHPVYASGVTASILTAIAKAGEDLYLRHKFKKKQEASIDNLVANND